MVKKSLLTLFDEIYESPPDIFSSAPGRINIIGEHTDYNQGYVLPAAINFRIYFLAKKRKDDQVLLWAQNFEERIQFSLDDLSTSKQKRWANYVKGILWVLEREGFHLQGINGLIWGDIPLEAGLSSSAAMEVSIINGLDTLFNLRLDKKSKAFLAQKAENDFVGVKCGIMDQFISLFGEKKKALFLDCETFSFELIPFEIEREGLSILVYDTQVRRELASSEYNKRRKEALEAFHYLKGRGYRTFKEVNLEMLEKIRGGMGDVSYRRALHVVSENTRVREAVKALRENDFLRLGELLFQSHESLRDNYEVSCAELDLLYETGRGFPGCLGARLTGAGFGGSGIALVENPRVHLFKNTLFEGAEKRELKKPKMYEIVVDEGAQAHHLTKEERR